MSDYYIRITDEEPVEMDRGIRFRYDGTGSEAEFTIVDDEAYNGLVEQVNLFSNNFSGAVNYSLDNILDSKVVPKADKCVQIVEDITNSNSESITFTEIKNVIMEYVSQSQLSTLTSTVTSISNSITNILGRLTSLEINSATKSQLTSLTQTVNTKENLSNKTSSWNSSTNDTRYPTEKLVKSSLDNKSDKTHTHSDWTSVKFNEYCSGYINSAIRIVVMRYYRKDYNFKQTSAIKLHSGLFKNYKPAIGGDVILPLYYPEMGGYIDNTTGDMYVYSKIKGSRIISTSGMWRY